MRNLNTDQKNILSFYGLFGAGAIMMMVPYGVTPFAGVACAIVVLFAAYFYRWRRHDDEPFKFHMTHIIRTSWLSQLILLVGIILFGTIIFNNGDMGAINAMANMAENGVVPNSSDIVKMQLNFIEANKSLIITSGMICLIPYPLYLLYRIVNGVRILTQKEF